MTRTQWIVVGTLAAPVLIGATVVSATLGPAGAISYGALLLAGINSRHLFRDTHLPLPRFLTPKGRHR